MGFRWEMSSNIFFLPSQVVSPITAWERAKMGQESVLMNPKLDLMRGQRLAGRTASAAATVRWEEAQRDTGVAPTARINSRGA